MSKDARPPIQDRAQALETIARLRPDWAGRATNLVYLPGGYSHANYRFRIDADRKLPERDYVVRIAGSSSASGAEIEYLQHGLGPNLVAFDGTGAMITEWIDGSLLIDEPPSPQQAGRYIAALHERIPMGVRRYDHRGIVARYMAVAEHVDPVAQAAFERHWQPHALVGCHNDLNPWNIIRDGEDWHTLDWEFAGDHDPLFDLVAFCAHLGWGETETLSCLRAYGGDCSEQRFIATRQAFWLREYAWAVAQLARGNPREEVRAQAGDMLAALRSVD